MTDAVCPDCGDPLDDFSACACAFSPGDRVPPKVRDKPRPEAWNMRTMVHRKLKAQGKR